MGELRASIIIPTFNAEKTIARALISARSQSEARLEVIVVDDASTDRTSTIVADEAVVDHRVRLLRLPLNVGPAAARNQGIAIAKGDWIALLDADDSYHPERIEKLLALADQVGPTWSRIIFCFAIRKARARIP